MKAGTNQLSLAAAMLASVFVVTRFVQIPIPLGYFNVGNTVILLFCLLVNNSYGIAASGIGSALADLMSYPVYTVPTLLIKTLMPWIFLKLGKLLPQKKYTPVVSAAFATLIPLFGYTIAGGLIYGNIISGIAQFPGLLLEYIANLVIFAVLYKPVTNICRAYSAVSLTRK